MHSTFITAESLHPLPSLFVCLPVLMYCCGVAAGAKDQQQNCELARLPETPGFSVNWQLRGWIVCVVVCV
jgi:hypothetical protein